jgi:hypothetical protein
VLGWRSWVRFDCGRKAGRDVIECVIGQMVLEDVGYGGSKGGELHVNILTVHIPDNTIITWKRSVTPKKRRGNQYPPQMFVALFESKHTTSEAEL